MSAIDLIEQNLLPPLATRELTETFGESLNHTFSIFRIHPLREDLLNQGVDYLVNFCTAYSPLAPLVVLKDQLRPRLVSILKQLLLSQSEFRAESDLLTYFLNYEHDLVFRTLQSQHALTFYSLLLFVRQFADFLDHFFALERLKGLEEQQADAFGPITYLKHFKFKAFSFEFFITVRAFIARLVRLRGESEAVHLLERAGLHSYLERFHSFATIKKLLSDKPNMDIPRYLLKDIRNYSILKVQAVSLDAEMEVAFKSEVFSLERILKNIATQSLPEPLQPSKNHALLVSPTDTQTDMFGRFLIQHITENPSVQAQFTSQAKHNLRFFTLPTLEGKHQLNIFHRDFAIKRVQNLKPKRACFKLLDRLLRSTPKRLVTLERLHLNTRQSFQEHLRDFICKGHTVTDDRLQNQSDDVKKFNRRWNKFFMKIAEVVAEDFLALYTSFIFEEGLKRAFLEKGQDLLVEIRETVFGLNFGTSLPVDSFATQDRKLSEVGQEKIVVVQIKPAEQIATFSFFKGWRKKNELDFKVSQFDKERRILLLENDQLLGQLFAEFAPSCALIIADCKESFYLKHRVGVLMSGVIGSLQAEEDLNRSPFVFFFNESFAHALANSTKKLSLAYNFVLQKPLLASLVLFSKAVLTGPGLLFKNGKRVLDPDFIIFAIKNTLKEALFEQGIFGSDLLHSDIGPGLCSLFGLGERDEQEIRLAFELNQKERLFNPGLLSPNARSLLPFLKLDKHGSKLPDFNFMKIPVNCPNGFIPLLVKLTSLGESDILALRDAANRFLAREKDRNIPEDLQRDITLLETMCSKDDFANRVVFMRTAIYDFAPRLNPKFFTAIRKSNSPLFEEKLINILFKTEKAGIKPGCIVNFKIKDIDLKMIRGTINEHFSGLLMLENVGARPRTVIQEGELSRFFSRNEVLRCLVRRVFSGILRVDVSLADADIANIRNYITRFNVLRTFRLDFNSFCVDFERDVPTLSLFTPQERNFDFVNYSHPKVRNSNFREIKTSLREGKKVDFFIKPAERHKTFDLDLVIYFPQQDAFEVLPISCAAGSDPSNEIVDPEQLTFRYSTFSFKGISEFQNRFIDMLIINLTTIYNDQNFTKFSSEAIFSMLKSKGKGVFQSSLSSVPSLIEDAHVMMIETEPAKNTPFYYISKALNKPLVFKLFYVDRAERAGSKSLTINHEYYSFVAKSYVTFNKLVRDLQQKPGDDEAFLHKDSEDKDSVESLFTEILDTSSNISIVTGDISIAFKGSKGKEGSGSLFNTHQRDASANFSSSNNNTNPNEQREFRQNNSRFNDRTGNNFGSREGNTNNFDRQPPRTGARPSFGQQGNNNPHRNNFSANNETAKPQNSNTTAPAPSFELPSWGTANETTSEPVVIPTWGAGANTGNAETIAPVSWGNNENAETNEVPKSSGLNLLATWGNNESETNQPQVIPAFDSEPQKTSGSGSWNAQPTNTRNNFENNRGENRNREGGDRGRGRGGFRGGRDRGSAPQDNSTPSFGRQATQTNNDEYKGNWNTDRDGQSNFSRGNRNFGDSGQERGGFRGGRQGERESRGGWREGAQGERENRDDQRGGFNRGGRGFNRDNNRPQTPAEPSNNWGGNTEQQQPSWGNSGNEPAPRTNSTNNEPSWGASTEVPQQTPSWGANTGGNAEASKQTPSWGANTGGKAEASKQTPSWGANTGENTDALQQTPSWGNNAPSKIDSTVTVSAWNANNNEILDLSAANNDAPKNTQQGWGANENADAVPPKDFNKNTSKQNASSDWGNTTQAIPSSNWGQNTNANSDPAPAWGQNVNSNSDPTPTWGQSTDTNDKDNQAAPNNFNGNTNSKPNDFARRDSNNRGGPRDFRGRGNNGPTNSNQNNRSSENREEGEIQRTSNWGNPSAQPRSNQSQNQNFGESRDRNSNFNRFQSNNNNDGSNRGFRNNDRGSEDRPRGGRFGGQRDFNTNSNNRNGFGNRDFKPKNQEGGFEGWRQPKPKTDEQSPIEIPESVGGWGANQNSAPTNNQSTGWDVPCTTNTEIIIKENVIDNGWGAVSDAKPTNISSGWGDNANAKPVDNGWASFGQPVTNTEQNLRIEPSINLIGKSIKTSANFDVKPPDELIAEPGKRDYNTLSSLQPDQQSMVTNDKKTKEGEQWNANQDQAKTSDALNQEQAPNQDNQVWETSTWGNGTWNN